MVVLIIEACVVSGGTLLFKKSSGTLNPCRINILSLSYYFIMIQTILGAVLVSLGYTEHYTYMRLNEPEKYAQMGVVYSMITLALFPLVSFIILKLCGVNSEQEYTKYLNKKTMSEHGNLYFCIILIASIFASIFFTVLLFKIGYIPIIELLFHGDKDFSMERARNVGMIIMGREQIKNIFVLYAIPLLSFISFSFQLVTKDYKWKILFLVLFFESVIVKTYDFSKAPLVLYIAVLILIVIFYKGKINYLFAVIVGGSCATLLAMAYRLLGYSKSFLDIYNGILGRTIFTQFGVLCMHFEGFSKYINFLHGKSLYPTVLKLIGVDPEMHVRSSQIIMDLYNPEGVYNGSAGVMNTLFVGEAYANWGHLGALFSIVWVAFIITVTFIVFLKLKKTPITIAFFAFISQQFACCIQGGFIDFIYNSSILITVVLLILLYSIPNLYKVKKCCSKVKKSSD